MNRIVVNVLWCAAWAMSACGPVGTTDGPVDNVDGSIYSPKADEAVPNGQGGPTRAHLSATSFAVREGKLYLVGVGAEAVRHQCRALHDHALWYLSRNGREPSETDGSACEQVAPMDEDFWSDAYLPNYLDDLDDAVGTNRLLEIVKHRSKLAVDISNVMPASLWSRHRVNRSYDDVCYNSALVASGILSENERSSFLTEIEYFLSMNHINIEQSDSQVRLVYGPRNDLALADSRRAWEFTTEDLDRLKQEMDEHIDSHFGHGGILGLIRFCRQVS